MRSFIKKIITRRISDLMLNIYTHGTPQWKIMITVIYVYTVVYYCLQCEYKKLSIRKTILSIMLFTEI